MPVDVLPILLESTYSEDQSRCVDTSFFDATARILTDWKSGLLSDVMALESIKRLLADAINAAWEHENDKCLDYDGTPALDYLQELLGLLPGDRYVR